MVDPILALRSFYLADPDVAAFVGTRVFGGDLPASEAQHMPRQALIIQDAGSLGVFGESNNFGDLRIDLKCYGATPYQAWQVRQAVKQASKHRLLRVVSEGVLLHWARQAGGTGHLRDADTGWPFHVTSWQVLASEVEVPA